MQMTQPLIFGSYRLDPQHGAAVAGKTGSEVDGESLRRAALFD